MSNFAERLVARSTGAPPGPGISVLAPRPVSRFEPVASVDIETNAGLTSAESFIATRTATDLESDTVSASTPARTRIEGGEPVDKREATVPQPLEDTIHHSRHTAHGVHPETQEHFTPLPPSYEGETRPKPIVAKPDAGDAFSERHEALKMRDPAGAPRLEIPERAVRSELAASPPAGQPPNERAPPPAASRQTPDTPAISAAEAGRPPAPVISIGKIEVQFLPQEPRVAPRPQPQHTRGFDAYARARRGEPR